MGVTFPEITINYIVDGNNAGPILTCSSLTQGSRGSVRYYINIISFQAAKLEGNYQQQKAAIQVFVDQSTQWNADPAVPERAKHQISIIKDDSDGYIFTISSEANVQNCYRGYGYGVEKVDGKYLVHVEFESCELPDAAAYNAVMQNLEAMALTAVLRVESAGKP